MYAKIVLLIKLFKLAFVQGAFSHKNMKAMNMLKLKQIILKPFVIVEDHKV